MLAAGPEALDAQRSASIEREQAKEVATVTQKYGNKKSSELPRDERAAMIRELAAAEKKVLEKYGVSAKDWAKAKQNRSREQAQNVSRAVKTQDAEEKAEAERLAAEAAEKKDVVVQRGISDDNPAVLEETEGAAPIIEQGLPSEYTADQQAAAEADALEKTSEPAPKSSGKSKR